MKLTLYYKNNTNSCFYLYPEAIIGMTHDQEAFISYKSPSKIVYKLIDECNYDYIIELKPREIFEYKFDIKPDSCFFTKGRILFLFFITYLIKH